MEGFGRGWPVTPQARITMESDWKNSVLSIVDAENYPTRRETEQTGLQSSGLQLHVIEELCDQGN